MTTATAMAGSHPRGTSLVETILACALLATVILAVFGTILSSDTLDVAAREEQRARAAAESVINKMRASPFLTFEPTYGYDPEQFQLDATYIPYKKLIDMTELNRTEGQMREGEQGVGTLCVYILTSPLFCPGGVIDEEMVGVDLNHADSHTKTTPSTWVSGADGNWENDTVNVLSLFPFTLQGGSGADLYPVVVTVRWTGVMGGRRKISLQSMITDRTGRG